MTLRSDKCHGGRKPVLACGIGMVVAMAVCASSGCGDVEYTIDKDGLHLLNASEEEFSFRAYEEDGEHCVESIGDAEEKLSIDAFVSDPEVGRISPLKAELSLDAIRMDGVIDAFFDGGDNLAEGDNEGTSLDSLDGAIHFELGPSGGFEYRNDELLSWRDEMIRTHRSYVRERDISDTFTAAMAEQQLLDALSKIMDMEVRMESCVATYYYSEEGHRGYYEFSFVPMIGHMPVAAIDEVELMSENDLMVKGEAQVCEDGISLISTDCFLWKEVESPDGPESDCLTLDGLFDALGQYVADGIIPVSDGFTYSTVSLSWLPVGNGQGTAELVPVWRLHTPYRELGDMESVAVADDLPTDLCISAIDGEIVRMGLLDVVIYD